MVLWVVLILLGTFLRGPNWNFFGPYEFWDLHKVIPLNNVNLSDLVWVQFLGTTKPTSIFVRELPGIVLVPGLLHPGALLCMYRLFFKKYTAQAGILRYHDPGRPDVVHGQFADQDGVALDNQLEIRRGHSRVILQYLDLALRGLRLSVEPGSPLTLERRSYCSRSSHQASGGSGSVRELGAGVLSPVGIDPRAAQ